MTELIRPIRTDRMQDAFRVTVEADEPERAAVAARLLLPAIAKLRCRWDLVPGEQGAIEASGLLQAEVTQECVVTLDPFTAALAEAFTVRFVLAGRESEVADDPDEPDELPYDGITVDLGEATVEQLALALDPYPRKPGAALPEEATATAGNVFSALAKLRRPD